LGDGPPQGLEILGRAWDEAKITGYGYAYEQTTHHRRRATYCTAVSRVVGEPFHWYLRSQTNMALTSRPVLSGVGSGPLLLGSGGDEAMHFANYIVLGLLIAFMLGAAPGGFLATQIIIATISLRLGEIEPLRRASSFFG